MPLHLQDGISLTGDIFFFIYSDGKVYIVSSSHYILTELEINSFPGFFKFIYFSFTLKSKKKKVFLDLNAFSAPALVCFVVFIPFRFGTVQISFFLPPQQS